MYDFMSLYSCVEFFMRYRDDVCGMDANFYDVHGKNIKDTEPDCEVQVLLSSASVTSFRRRAAASTVSSLIFTRHFCRMSEHRLTDLPLESCSRR